MANPKIKIKRSSVAGKVPHYPSTLDLGEFAINTADGKVFIASGQAGVGIGTTVQEVGVSTALVLSGIVTSGSFVGPLTGAVTGNVTGNVTGDLTGNVTGDVTIGTPTGGFKSGAFTISNTDKTKDSINELNNILGKLVPSAPTTIDGVSISLTGTAGNGRLCAGFTPTNNTGGSAPVAGTQYTRNTDSTVSTSYITEYGPGDSGTVTGLINAVGVGTITLASGDQSATSDALQIANDEDASNSSRDSGIAAGFYEIYDVRIINAASPDGYNLAKITHGSATTGSVYWYEDPSTVGAPVISYSTPITPASPTLAYSSGIPHYTEASANAFTYVMTVENATGDMYTSNSFINSDGQTSGFQNPGDKSYTDFA